MSKLILFDFECSNCGNKFEELVKSTEHSTPCPKCQWPSVRLISPPHFDTLAMGIYPKDFPTAGAKWEKLQRQKSRSDKGSLRDGAPNLKMY